MNDIRVLVVDDDFRVAGLHRDLVAGLPGFTALEPAGTVARALAAIGAHTPDLLLVDVYLPDGDGVEVLRGSGADGFVLSAATDPATVRRALRGGALDYLIKPFERGLLVDRLERYRRYRNLLADGRALTQDDLDRAVATMRGGRDAPTLARSTTEQAVLTALGDDEASATQVAERVGVSRATAQRHLTALAERRLVRVGLRYGTTGRPEHRFRSQR